MKYYKNKFYHNPLLLMLFILLALFMFKLITIVIQYHPILTLFIVLAICYYLSKPCRLNIPAKFHYIKPHLNAIRNQLLEYLSYSSYWDKYLLNEEINLIIKNFLKQNPDFPLRLETLNHNNNFLQLSTFLNAEYHLSSIVILLLISRQKHILDFEHYKNFILSNKDLPCLDTLIYNTVLYNKVNSKSFNIHFLKWLCKELQLCKPKIFFLRNRYLRSIYSQKESLLSHQQLRSQLLNTDSFFKDNILISQYIHHLIPNSDFDDSPNNYHIVGKDYLRETSIENFYKNHFNEELIKSFGGCAHCKSAKMGYSSLEYDHFWLPKSLGGNFAMRHKNGYYVNNCVPLCGDCNKKKSAKSIYEFYSPEELSHIIETSQSLNIKLNKMMTTYQDNYFPNRKF